MELKKELDLALGEIQTENKTKEVCTLNHIEFWNINRFDRGIEGMPDWLWCFDKKDLVLLAGYPSTGKTEFTFFLAKENAKNWQKVLYISLELPAQQLIERLARKKTWITKKMRQDNDITEQQMNNMERQFNKVKDLENLVIAGYKSSPNVDMLEDTIRKYKKQGFDLFFIDNLGKITGEDNENKRFDIISSRLQDLKNNQDICIFLLHHLSKPQRNMAYSPWWPWAIRGSQKLIDNSSLVFEIYRDLDPDAIENDKKRVELILYKDTMDGATWIVELEFQAGEYVIYNKTF